VAELLGVARETVRDWFSSNISADKGTKPDARVKLNTQKKIAKELRKVDAKRWTQKAVAELLGVGRQTVSDWFTTNADAGKGSKPDARVKLNTKAKEVVAERVKKGDGWGS
jgi:predicted XRE-type DNA-binding protein